MLSRMQPGRTAGACTAPIEAPACRTHAAVLRLGRRPVAVAATPTQPRHVPRAYDDDGEGGLVRPSRASRSRTTADRRQQQRGRSRKQDDDEWGGGAGDEEVVEVLAWPGAAPAAEPAQAEAAGSGAAEQAQGREWAPDGAQERRGGRPYGGRGGAGGGRWGGAERRPDAARGGGWQGGAAGERPDGGGRRYGRGGGEEKQEKRTYRGPREALSPEALEARNANNDAVRAAADWRAVGVLLAERGAALDGENVTLLLFKVARDGRPASPSEGAEFEALVASLYGWVVSMVGGLRPKQVATCLYSVARLELFNADLVAALAERALHMMGSFNPWEYSNMVWAFGRMNYTPGDEWLRQFTFWSEKRLVLFKPVELSNTVAALAKLGYVPGAAWMDALTAAAAAQAPQFNNLEFVNLLFGLASLGYAGGPAAGSWLEALVDGPSGCARVEGMRVSDLQRTTWALTQVEWRPSEAWLAAAARAFVAQLRYCLPSDLATISYSLAYLRAAPSPDGLRLLAAALPRCWGRLSGDELANVAMSLALWQYKPSSDRWLDELVIAARDKLAAASPDGLSKYVSALPLLGSGYRLNQVVAQAQALLDGAAQEAQEPQQHEAAPAAVTV